MTAGKASLVKRLFAKAIDILAAFGCAALLPRIIGVPLGVAYLLAADGVLNGQSLGKMVFALEVDRQDGGACDLKSSAWRNIPVALAFLLFFLYLPGILLLGLVGLPLLAVEVWLMAMDAGGARLGDRLASTVVAEAQR